MAHPRRSVGGDGVIRIERDPNFWVSIAAHPALAGVLYGLAPAALVPIIAHPNVTPLAAEHGGFIFSKLDAWGFVYELHTLFTPEGWGREVAEAAKEATLQIFGQGGQVITTLQVRENRQSQPPRSFGFVAAGDWTETVVGESRCWLLTKDAWEASAVRKRMLS